MSLWIAINRASLPPFDKIICYPTGHGADARVKEFMQIGVTDLGLVGRAKVNGIRVLGKGTTSIVILCRWHGKKKALKVRRVDAGGSGANHEAIFLKRANDCMVGPKLCTWSENSIVMEYLQGITLGEWLMRLQSYTDAEVKSIISNLLIQARKLDVCGIIHRELGNASRHAIISKERATFVDFGTAGLSMKASNVTSLANYLFLQKTHATQIEKHIHFCRDELLGMLKEYKISRADKIFGKLLQLIET
ncbi:MAG: hypothetical protein QXQ39_01790 [Conexivisphaerales archaeon]